MKRQNAPLPYGGQSSLYDHEYRQYVQDIPFYTERLVEHRVSATILELGCGTGRITFPLARAGFSCLGIDNSTRMLRVARNLRRELPSDVTSRVRFSQQDMAQLKLKGRFGAALVPFSGLGFLTQAEQRATCLRTLAAHLEPGAPLIVDHFQFRPSSTEGEQTAERTSFRMPPFGHTVEKHVTERLSEDARVLHVRYEYFKKPFIGEEILGTLTVEFALAVLTPDQLEAELHEAGFSVEALYGDYRGNPLTERSGRILVEAVR